MLILKMGVSENTGPLYSTLNNRILIGTPKYGTPNFGNPQILKTETLMQDSGQQDSYPSDQGLCGLGIYMASGCPEGFECGLYKVVLPIDFLGLGVYLRKAL